MGARRPEAVEKCPDAGRVAPISACVSYQIDRLKSRHCYVRELRSNGGVFNRRILARRVAPIRGSVFFLKRTPKKAKNSEIEHLF